MPGMPHDAAGRLAAHAAVLESTHHAPSHPQSAHQSRLPPAVDVSNWAADFNRFARPTQRHEPQQGGFHHQPQPLHMNPPASQFGFQAAFAQPNAGFSPLYGPPNSGMMDPNGVYAQRPAAETDFDQEMSRWMASHGNSRGMEDVDAVMDQMARELELSETVLAEAEKAAQDTVLTAETRLDEKVHSTNLETPEIGNLSIESNDPTVADPDDPKGKSAVSEAAERLLESVQHEDGEKWKNSVFLSLMRDFRDGRKDIFDNEIRETPDEVASTTQAAN